jgi:CRISPR-associated protein Cas1
MTIEGRVAGLYWQEFGKAVPKEYEFQNRQYQKRPRGAGDTTNCLLNYGYAILEAEVLRGINGAGLDAHIGFLHEMRIGANSLAYDLQEPFRFLVDLAVLDLLESGSLERSDFVRSETYTLRLRASGAKKLVKAIEEKLVKKVNFNSQMWSVRYVIQEKIRELAHYLVDKRSNLDLCKPHIPIDRQDTDAVRQQIVALSYVEWEKMGFSRGTLHYLKHNARSGKPFTMNEHVRDRLTVLQDRQ